MSKIDDNKFARKIFFLFIPRESGEKIVKKIVSREFEAYAFFDDAEPYLPVLEKMAGAIIFAYVPRGENNILWDECYERLASCAEDVDLTITTWIGDTGYITFDAERSNVTPQVRRIDIAEHSAGIIDHIVAFLASRHAMGNRRHLRVYCGENSSSSFSIKRLETSYSGKVLDISSFGMACVFNSDIELKIHLFIDDIQLRLSGQSYNIAGSILAKRVIDNKTVYVIVFDFMENDEARSAVIDFVYRMLQRNFRKMYG
jgi:hypothetical protein